MDEALCAFRTLKRFDLSVDLKVADKEVPGTVALVAFRAGERLIPALVAPHGHPLHVRVCVGLTLRV